MRILKQCSRDCSHVEDIICDMCHESTKDMDGRNFEFAEMKADWGFYSQSDMARDELHLCESCYRKAIDLLNTHFGLKVRRLQPDAGRDEFDAKNFQEVDEIP